MSDRRFSDFISGSIAGLRGLASDWTKLELELSERQNVLRARACSFVKTTSHASTRTHCALLSRCTAAEHFHRDRSIIILGSEPANAKTRVKDASRPLRETANIPVLV